MICGAVAAAAGSSSGNSYPDALASIDFILGSYWHGNNQLTVNDAVELNSNSVIDASGLYLDSNDPTGVVEIIGAIRTVLNTANYTLVMEWRDLIATGTSFPLYLSNVADTDYIWIDSQPTTVACYDQLGVGGADRSTIVSGLTARPATRRVAITRVASKLVLSVNGSAINSAATSLGALSLDRAAFGGLYDDGYPWRTSYMRRLIVYSEQSDAALPGLSTV